jgi:hypothetical protein
LKIKLVNRTTLNHSVYMLNNTSVSNTSLSNARNAAITALNAVCGEYDAYQKACEIVNQDAIPFSKKVWPTFGPISPQLNLAIWARKHLVTPDDVSGITPNDRRFRRIERKFRHSPDSVARSGAYRSFAV